MISISIFISIIEFKVTSNTNLGSINIVSNPSCFK